MVVFVDLEAEGTGKDPIAFRNAYFLACSGSPLDHFDEAIQARRLSSSAFGEGNELEDRTAQLDNDRKQDQGSEELSRQHSTVTHSCSSNSLSGFAAALGCYPYATLGMTDCNDVC